ncbi:uncharacterized protein K02A2.6-like [Planococcus citri]|uniref:uncharacterized protein K02A2.6-like n=1 Tax=Planococcus citri TaxID=170843 RepID=UPI0031F929D0
MKQLARRYCFWPGIDSDIEKTVKSCDLCATHQRSPAKVPVHKWEIPDENFDRVHIDFAGPKDGLHFLILVDSKSKWPEVRVFKKDPTSESTMVALEDIFSTHGYPRFLVSDNATLFKSEKFQDYCRVRGIFQIFTAPGKPSTNGLAERFVQTLKSKLTKMKNENLSIEALISKVLFKLRSTPLADGLSPAEKYLKRRLRIRLDAIKPIHLQARTSNPERSVRSFKVGNRVVVEKCRVLGKPVWTYGTILRRLGRLHYIVQLDDSNQVKKHIDQIRSTTFVIKERVEENKEKKRRVTFEEELARQPTNPGNNQNIEEMVNVPNQQPEIVNVPNQPPPQLRPQRERRLPTHLQDYVLR